ncbi:MAG TPA: PilZ domain-containing protein [Terriglobales bacterium]|jgi:DNA-binding NarL/FixJ family response regulator|nr:PilZ domain-containing protein [Terriglobales bacterium]
MTRLEGLLLTSDAQVVSVMNQVLDNFEIETQVCSKPDAAVDVVTHRKLDTLILDWNSDDEPTQVMSALRKSHQNAKSTAVAIVGGAPEMHEATSAGANFMIYKPMSVDQATHCLRAAYGNILLQRRRSARYVVDIPVTANLIGVGQVEGKIIDLSAGGLAFQCPQPVQTDQQISIGFKLPGTSILIHVNGRVAHVVNKDGRTRAGMCFSFVPQREFALLEQWLATHLAKMMDEMISKEHNDRVN